MIQWPSYAEPITDNLINIFYKLFYAYFMHNLSTESYLNQSCVIKIHCSAQETKILKK